MCSITVDFPNKAAQCGGAGSKGQGRRGKSFAMIAVDYLCALTNEFRSARCFPLFRKA
jgi:hypothetical protein